MNGKNEIFLKIRVFREKFRFSYSNHKIGTNLNNSEQLAAMQQHQIRIAKRIHHQRHLENFIIYF